MTEVGQIERLNRPEAKPRRKLHKRFTPLAFAFYMVLIMAFFMCCIIVAVNGGLGSGYWSTVLRAYVVAMPSAFGCVVLVRPVVTRLVAATVYH